MAKNSSTAGAGFVADRGGANGGIEVNSSLARMLLAPDLSESELKHLRDIAGSVAHNLCANFRHLDVEDLASVGFYKALESYYSFDQSRTNHSKDFFLMLKAKRAMMDELRKWDTVSRGVRFRQRVMIDVENEFYAQQKRHPTDEEVAERMEISVEKLHALREQIAMSHPISLTATFSDDDADNFTVESAYSSTWESPATQFLRRELYDWVRRAVKRLKHIYGAVVQCYYFEEMSGAEIGKRFGVTESRISQIHKSALVELRCMMLRAGLYDSLE